MSAAKVYIVDDERQVSLALSIRLKAAGYDVAAAYDGESALADLPTVKPDVILLDIRMPGIDGIEVMKRMKQDPAVADIPVIFVSANAQERVKRDALNAGGRYFLEKPFDADVLLQTLELVLKGGREVPSPT